MTNDKPLVPWMLSFLRPHRGRVALLAALLLAEIVLGALQQWPLAIVIDYVLVGNRFPSWIQSAVDSVTPWRMQVRTSWRALRSGRW